MSEVGGGWFAAGRKLALGLVMGWMGMAAQAAVVTDIAGRQVEVPARVERILLGEGRLFYAFALLEGKQPLARIAGWQGDFRYLDPQTYAQYKAKFPAIDRIPLIGKTNEESVSAEKVLTLKPDIAVFSIAGHGPSLDNPIVKQLEAAQVPVIFVDFRIKPMENTIPSLRIMGRALQREATAERFIRFYQEQLRAVTGPVSAIPAAQRPTVFLDVRAGAFDHVASAGKGSLGEMVDAAGGRNIGDTLLPIALGEVNMEKVLAMNPSVYIATGAGAPDARTGLKFGADVSPAMARESLQRMARRGHVGALAAVRNGNTYGAWHHFYNTPYHVVLIQQIAKWLHPARFARLDPQASWVRMHKEFLAIEPQGTYWVGGRP